MSKAAELIAGLQTDGEFDSAGSFSLDREKARQKMRQFQLSDPHRYVLMLVEAAVLRGATSIVFDIDSDDMQMRFDAALSWADLDELYTSLFVDRSTVEIRARRELALACNAVMALNPRWVRIESFSPGEDGQLQGVAATLQPDSDDEISKLSAPSGAPPAGMKGPWTTIHVKDRFRPGLLVRFVHDLRGSIPEEILIRQRCAYASLPITLDELRVSHGLPQTLIGGVRFEIDDVRGVAGIEVTPERRDRSAMVLLSNGVEIVTHTLGDSIKGLWFWVDSPRFRKDVSQGDIVRSDPAYEQMLQTVAAARNNVLERLVDLWAAGKFTVQTEPTANEVFDLLRECFLRWGDHKWLQHDAGPLGRLADMPIWRLLDQRWLSPRALAEEADAERGIMYTHRDFDGVLPQGWGPVIHLLDGFIETEAIERIYSQALDATEALEREVPWELNRRKWRARTHAMELPQGTLRYPIAFEQGAYRGRVAMRPGQLSSVRVIVDGCLLSELELDLGFMGLGAVITGPFEPIRDYTRPRRDRAYATALMLLLAQVPRLLEAWALDEYAGDVVQRCLVALTRPHFARTWLESFGYSAESAKQLVTRLGVPALLPALELGSGQGPSAVARAVSFVTVDGRRVTLAELDSDRRERPREPGKILIVDRSAPTITGEVELLVHADADDRRLLTAVFGLGVIHDDTEAYTRELGRRSFEAKPHRFPSAPLKTWATEVELGHGESEAPAKIRAGRARALGGAGSQSRIRGYVGIGAGALRDWQSEDRRRVAIEVITGRRHLCVIEERSWVPNVEAALAWEDAPINEDWDGLAGSTSPLRDAVDAGIMQIVRELAERAMSTSGGRPSDDVRQLLWLVMVAPFVSVEHVRAWKALRAHHGEDHGAAVQAYFEVMELFPGVPLADLREAITLLLEEGKPPTRAAILSILERAVVPPGGGRGFHRQVLESYELLESVPLISLVSGDTMSLAALSEVFEGTGEISYVEDPSLHWASDEYVIVRANEIDQVALMRLFGRDMFHEVSGWIHERRHQQRFESRDQLEHMRVPDHNRLVGVEFERDGFCGELAIPAWTAGEGGDMKITLCHDRRVVQELALHGALPVIGVVDDPKAELSADYSGVDVKGARVAALRGLLDEVLSDQLLPRLAEAYPGLDVRAQALARTFIVTHWRRVSPRAGQHPNRLTEAGKAFAGLKLFRDVDGTDRSLDELIACNREQRCLWYVERHPGHAVAPPFCVVEARAGERELLADLFPNMRDFSDRWDARVEGERRKRKADTMPPAVAPPTALLAIPVLRHDMEGTLWLPDRYPFASGVLLGVEGKVVEVVNPIDLLLARGAVGGVDGGTLGADDSFEHVEFSGPQRRYLEARVIFLYSDLLGRHRRELTRPDKVEFMDPSHVQSRTLRFEVLRAAAVSLAKARVGGQSFDAILGNLERRLNDEPLLRLSSGKLTSVAVARKARPRELAHLGIWNPDTPMPELEELARQLFEDAEDAEDAEDGADAESDAEVSSEPELDLLSPLAPPGEQDDLVFEFSASDLEIMAEELVQPESAVSRRPEPEPEPDPVGELLERVREELRLLRERHRIELPEGLLDCVHAENGRGRELVSIDDRVVFDCSHPRFVRALQDPDPIWVSFLASVAYTALNRWLEEVTDEHELAFHAGHAELLLSGLLDGA